MQSCWSRKNIDPNRLMRLATVAETYLTAAATSFWNFCPLRFLIGLSLASMSLGRIAVSALSVPTRAEQFHRDHMTPNSGQRRWMMLGIDRIGGILGPSVVGLLQRVTGSSDVVAGL